MRKKLGELLIAKGILTSEKLNFYLHLQQERRRAGATVENTRLGQLLIIDGLFDQKALVRFLEEQSPGQINETATIFSEDVSFMNPPKPPPTASKLPAVPKSSPLLPKNKTEEKAVQQLLETLEFGERSDLYNANTILEIPSPKPEEKAKTELFISYERLPHSSATPILKNIERYELVKTIEEGEGNIGIVEILKDRVLNREVARKSLKPTHSSLKNLTNKQKIFLWKLKREAGITALLEHPNILPLYETQQNGSAELPFVLRKIDGKTLRTFLQRIEKGEQTFNEIQILSLFRKICEAVAYAHSQGVVHRDLKPENIHVGEFGEVYVLNWGSAKQTKELKEDFSGLDSSKGFLGTEGYMSPEQREDASKVNYQTDIYALGRILKECYLHAKREYPVPEAILNIEKKATQKLMEARYFLVQELLDDIELYQKRQEDKKKEEGLLRIFLNWSKKNPFKATIFLVGLGLFFSTGIYFQWKEASEYKNAFQEAQQKQQTKTLQTQNESKKQLKQHLQTLEEITLRFYKKKQEPEAILDAQFEISKMKEAEVFERLKKMLQEGIQYITEETHPDLNRIAFYEMIFSAIGYLENPEAGESLLTALKSLVKKTNATPRDQEISNVETALMVQLAYAFKKTQTLALFNSFQELREEMRFRKSSFFKRTTIVCDHFKEILIDDYSEKITQKPSDASLYQERGNAKRTLQDWAGAIADYDIALRLKPQSSQIYLDRGQAKKGNGFLAEAISDYTEAITLNAEWDQAYDYRGIARQEKGDIVEALSDFNKAIRLNPQDFMAYVYRALIKESREETKEALSDLEEAIKLNPQESNAYYHRGVIKLKKNDLDGSIADFNSAILVDPQNLLAYMSRGKAKEQKKEWEGAIQDYNFILRFDPENSQNTDIYYRRGRIKKEKSDPLGALSDFTEAIHLNPQHFSAYLHRGILKSDQGDYDNAINDFLEAIHLKPQEAEAYFYCGTARFKKKDFNGAIDNYSTALRLNSQEFSYFLNRGLIYLNKKELTQASEDFTTAIELNAYCAEAYYYRGTIRSQQNDANGAILDFSAINDQSSAFPVFHYEYGNAYLKKGDKVKAKDEFQKFLDSLQNKLDPSIRKNIDDIFKKYPELGPAKK